MTVYGVNNAAGAPVAFTSQNLSNVKEPAAEVSVGAGEQIPAVNEEQTKSSKRTKALLTLAALGAITYGLVRYRNAQALKPFIENLEKVTKDGGKLTTQLTKTKVKNPDGTTSEQVLKSVKTHFDKDGRKNAEIIHNFSTHERYSIFYDKDGNVTKDVVCRMSVPTKGVKKQKVEQSHINLYTRNNNEVETNTSIIDYSGSRPVKIFSSSKIEPIPVSNTST